MAGIGSAWGTREELLHPRDRHGRFRKKWKMAAEAIGRLTSFLDGFQPRSFQSDQQAAQYAFNSRKVAWTTPELRRLHMDWDEANESLQAGKMDPTTQRFVDMMDRAMVPTSDDLIASQTVPVEAFGLSPQQAQLEDGGLEDFIGLEIGDAGYSAMNLGSELSHPPGSVTLRVAVPKGTRAAMGGRSPTDRGLILDRDQPLIVTKVEPDGRGGWYVLAVAGSGKRTKGATAVADDRTHGRRGSGLTPEQREARITPQMSGEERLRVAQQNERDMQAGVTPAPGAATAPATPTPAPAPAAPASPKTPSPVGVPERQEPVLKEAVGPGSPEGKSPSEIATDADAAVKAQAEAPPAPPAPPTPDQFREAARELSVPSGGAQRREWKTAYDGILRGNDPADTLRELEADISFNKSRLDRPDWQATKGEKEANIKAQEDLADLISQQYGLPRRGQGGPTATPGAPSTQRESVPSPEAQQQRALDRMTKPELLAEAGDMGNARMTKDQLRQAIEARRTGAEPPLRPSPRKAPTKRAPAKRAVKAVPEPVAAPPQLAPAKKAVPEAPAAPVKATKAVAKKAVPAKAVPEANAEDEAFKARVREAGLDPAAHMTDLRAKARDQKIRGFSTMNKKQLLSALMGDEVPKAGKIAPVTPRKLVPHLEAAESDQAARALLESHTLPDLKELAKHRELVIPKRGATKDRLKDMILTDVRGEQEGITGRTPDTTLEDDLTQLGYTDLPGVRGEAMRREIAGVDAGDPESLRGGRDNLEDLSREYRRSGDKDAANVAQAAADAMGMRAQTISGVEEAAPPVKRVAKKAAPEVPEGEEAPEVERPLEKMLKPELLALAQKEGASAVRPSWSKAKILDEIKKNRRMDSSRGGETQEDRLRRELGQLPGGPERDLGPQAGPLRLPDRAPTAEEIVRDNPDLDVRKLFNDAGIPGPDPGGMVRETNLVLKQEGPKVAADRLRREADKMIERIPEARAQSQRTSVPFPGDADTAEENLRADAARVREVADKIEAKPPVKKVAKRAAKKAVDQAAETISTQLKGTFGDQLRQEDPDSVRDSVRAVGLEPRGNTSEEIFDNALKDMLENRMRELGMLPEDPKKPTRAQKRVPKGSVKGPKADVPIETLGRRDSFVEAWDGQGFVDDPSLTEIRDDIASGEISQEEGVRRLENEISFHEEEMSDLGAELRGMAPEDRDDADGIHARRAELSDAITNNKKAIKFLRSHAKDEAPVTREELESKLDGPEKAALDRVEVDDLKAAAKAEGLGDIEGDDKDTVVQNIAKKMTAAPVAPTKKALPEAAAGTAAGKITSSRVTPGHRIMVTQREDGTWDMADRKTGAVPMEVTEVRAGAGGRRQFVGRDDNGNEITIAGRRGRNNGLAPSQTVTLEPAPKAPRATKKAAQAARDEEAASGIALLARGGNNEPLIEGAPPRKAAKAAVPAKATPPPVVDLDQPKRHNAEVIGTGLDLDPKGEDRQWLDVVQSSLDRGEDGRQIADGLRREADSQRTLHNIRESIGGTEGSSPAARINRMELYADRLEGVRPIAKPVGQRVQIEGRKDMGTMAAANAQTRAFQDLKSGKSHTEVATQLRRAATEVGSRDHDPLMTRPVEFTPAERSAMKRSDAKMLRELADEIQAQGVAQRAEARAAKKAAAPAKKAAAPAKKAPSPRGSAIAQAREERKREGNGQPIVSEAVDRMVRQGGVLPGQDRTLSRLREQATPPKKRTAAELKRARTAAEMNGISVEEQLERFDQQKEDRKNLTGPVGEMIQAVLDSTMERLQAATNEREEQNAFAGVLQPELRTMADKLGLSTKGTKAQLIQRITDRVKGREAPGASAERAVPKAEAPSTGALISQKTSQPQKPHSWGTGGQRGDQHYYHPDGAIPMAMDRLGDDGQIDVGGGESLHNAMGDIATDMVMGRITPNAGRERLKILATRLPPGPARRTLENLIGDLQAPGVAMPDLPADTPAALRSLLDQMRTGFPIARATGRFGGATYEKSLIDKIADFIRLKASGKSGVVGMPQDLHTLINNHSHESQEGSMGLQQLSRSLMDSNSEIFKALQAWAKEIRARRST